MLLVKPVIINWKIIVGDILIFAGIAQFLKIFTGYKYTNTSPMVVGLGIIFIVAVIVGVYLVRQVGKAKLRSSNSWLPENFFHFQLIRDIAGKNKKIITKTVEVFYDY